MPCSGLTLVYNCGFGGCQAPVRPVPVFCPESSRRQHDDEIGQPIWTSLTWTRGTIVLPAAVVVEA
jgi:hypothetical protein